MKTDIEILQSFMPMDFPLDRYDLVDIYKEENKHEIEISTKLYPNRLVYCFEEKNVIPQGYNQGELLSKGFTEYKTIYDMPIRNNLFCIKIRTRRWLVKETNEVIFNDLKIVEKGTRDSKELAFFLNGPMTNVSSIITNYQQ